jgi:hypothetical protein
MSLGVWFLVAVFGIAAVREHASRHYQKKEAR